MKDYDENKGQDVIAISIELSLSLVFDVWLL